MMIPDAGGKFLEVKKEVSALKTLVHNHLRRYFKKNFERDPVIIPVLLEM